MAISVSVSKLPLAFFHSILRRILSLKKLKILSQSSCSEAEDSFESAMETNNVSIVKLILKKTNFNPSYKKNYPIERVSYLGHFEIARLLLNDSRVDPSANKNSAIGFASKYGHIKIVELLLKDETINTIA